jgi:Predicted N6-adenine-specific DNA methylase
MDGFNDIVTDYHKRAKDLRSAHGIAGASSALAWDAAMLPIRENSVDCILSDLPFGVRCMSSKKLHSFLPLLFGECARCLRMKTGKMTILCGSYQVVLDGLNQINMDNDLFESPTSIIPVNIGGLSAWIIKLTRTSNVATSLKNHRKRAATMTRKRYQTLTGSKRPQA